MLHKLKQRHSHPPLTIQKAQSKRHPHPPFDKKATKEQKTNKQLYFNKLSYI